MNHYIILGVDFGSSNSCVSYYDIYKKDIIVIPNDHGGFTTPTALLFDKDSDNILFGEIAKNAQDSPNKFVNIKRLIGSSETYDLIHDNKEITLSIPDLVTIFINYLKQFSAQFLGFTPNNIVITIPAYFNDSQREIIKQCCEKCNFNVLRIINEPTAAALAYSFTESKIQPNTLENIIVVDIGGGTTDISYLHMDYTNQVYQVKKVIGDNLLGGEDLTKYLMDYYKLPWKQCEKIKQELSFNNSTKIFDFKTNKQITISRIKFLDITRPFFNKIQDLYNKLITHSDQISKIIFVGGLTRIPHLKTLFPSDIPIMNKIDPDKTVSIGAAIYGALLNGLFDEEESFNQTILMDIIPLSIGVETICGIMAPIISKNSVIPLTRSKFFTNSDSDSTIDINVFQGERKFVKDNFFLTSFNLSNLPESPKNSLSIKVLFHVDSNSIITATASVNGITNSVVITKTPIDFNNISLNEIIEKSRENSLLDSENANKLLEKIELYDSFKNRLEIFHEKRDNFLENEHFIISQLNILFNETFEIITDYLNFTSNELKKVKITFEKEWHRLLFDTEPVFKDDQGQLIDIHNYTTLS